MQRPWDPEVGDDPRTAGRQLQILRAIAERTRSGVVVTDREGLVEWANAAFERMCGYPLDELRGQAPGPLLQGAATSATTCAQVRDAVAGRQPFDVELLNYANGGRQYWVQIEAEPMFDVDGAFSGYLAIETETTERRIAEASAAVTTRIGDRLLRAASVDEAARTVTDELVGMLDVRAAQVWVVEEGAADLRYVAGSRAAPEAQGWLDASAASVFRKGTEWVVGVGAPGVAWGTAAACIRTDFWQVDKSGRMSRRSAAARVADIRTVCATPVLGTDGVVAVIEIGGSHAYPGHERLPALLARVAHQLGAWLRQRRNLTLAENANRELRRQIADRSAQLFAAMTLARDAGAAAVSPSPGTVVNERYRIEEKLGEGGMGAVFRVVRVDDGTRWAMKVATTVRGTELARLAREAHLLSRIRHANVVQIADIDIATQGFLYIVLELVDGTDLHAWRRDRTEVPLDVSVPILLQIARGLYKLHTANIAHRDLKPQNVLVVADSERLTVKLADFGIARLGDDGAVDDNGVDDSAVDDSAVDDSGVDDDGGDDNGVDGVPGGPEADGRQGSSTAAITRARVISAAGRSQLATASVGPTTAMAAAAWRGVLAEHSSEHAKTTASPPRRGVTDERVARKILVSAVAASARKGAEPLPTTSAEHPLPDASGSSAGRLGVTRTGVVVGTVQYLAPEMLASANASPFEADLFALGVVAWELVVGRRPFEGPTGAVAFAAAASRGDPEARLRSGCPELDALVIRCLAVDAAARPTALTVMQTVETIAAQRGIPIPG
jgi:PAS domain S-box-containing protein